MDRLLLVERWDIVPKVPGFRMRPSEKISALEDAVRIPPVSNLVIWLVILAAREGARPGGCNHGSGLIGPLSVCGPWPTAGLTGERQETEEIDLTERLCRKVFVAKK